MRYNSSLPEAEEQSAKWSAQEYSRLIRCVKSHGEDWEAIARRLDSKSAIQCMQKFKNSQRSVKKGNWSAEEDDMLFAWVDENGPQKWTECSKRIAGRCGKQCRERWVNILNPDIKKGNWTVQEQQLIFTLL